ncbi:MAG: RNA methyltransferase [Spirochaetes bacterium]|nr:RNA methyltransferase [Spirochaetota bacterium]
MKNILDNFYIILVSPDESSNIGATCRAMKTMGFTNMRIACPKAYDENQIKYISLNAFDVYNNRQEFPSLGEALHDISVAAGITRRVGKKRKYRLFGAEEFGDFIFEKKYGKVAIVFGNEEHGLTDEEIIHCNMSVSIPSSPAFPSLNLSHAVQVITYVISKKATLHHTDGVLVPGAAPPTIDLAETEELVAGITASLKELGFFKVTDDKDMKIFLRDIFSRASLTERERNRLADLFKKIEGLSKSGLARSSELSIQKAE